MNSSDYAQEHGVKPETVRKWARSGRIVGAHKNERGVWEIPEGARPQYVPKRKESRTVVDDRWDFLKAHEKRQYVDAKILGCHEGDYLDIVNDLLKQGCITKSVIPFDGKWNTGYAITSEGLDCLREGKPSFAKFYKACAVAAGAVWAVFSEGRQ